MDATNQRSRWSKAKGISILARSYSANCDIDYRYFCRSLQRSCLVPLRKELSSKLYLFILFSKEKNIQKNIHEMDFCE